MKSNCPICDKEKVYKTKIGYDRFKDKPCRSCSNSISGGGKGNRRVINGKLKCISCEKTLKLDNFHEIKGKPQSYCKKCNKKKCAKYHKEVYRFAKYNITKEDYDKMLKDQDSKCLGCEIELLNPNIDHCHKTGEVRGILCPKCNRALGLLYDNVDTLRNLIKYLVKED